MNWKTQGSSFNSLVKRNTTGIDVRANDRIQIRSNRHGFQVYELPDSSGSGIEAKAAEVTLEFGKCDFGVEASHDLFFNDAYHGIDSSANIQFKDISGSLGHLGIWFRGLTNLQASQAQNILITDTSGESLLIRLRPFWEGNTDNLFNIDPSWNYAPGSFTQIGCPVPGPLSTGPNYGDVSDNPPNMGGSLGAVTIDIGGGNENSNNGNDISSDIRAKQLAKAIGNPSTQFHWRNPSTWENYPKLQVAAEHYDYLGADSSACLIWQMVAGNSNVDISYNPIPGDINDASSAIIHWDSISHPLSYDGSFNSGIEAFDISQNITLEDSSGETQIFRLNADLSSLTRDVMDASASLGSITVPMGKIYLDWEKAADNLIRPNAMDRSLIFIEAVNQNWGDKKLEISAKSNPDVSGNVILTQDYGGVVGNTDIIYNPLTGPIISNENFGGGVNGSDSSQNIVLTDICNNTLQFRLNVDLSDNDAFMTDSFSGNPLDPSDVMVPMDNSSNRITGEERANRFYKTINNANIYIKATYDSSKVTLYQQFPGVSGNMIDVSYNNPSLGELTNSPITNISTLNFSGGINPVDASQTILMEDISGNKVLFYLDVDRNDASGVDIIGEKFWSYHVPILRGLGKTSEDILVSDAERAQHLKNALINSPLHYEEPVVNSGTIQYSINNGLPFRFQTLNITPNLCKLNIISSTDGFEGNKQIEFNPDPNNNEYIAGKKYPLLEKSITNYFFNEPSFSGGIDFLKATDKLIRTQNNIILRGGRHTQVIGDQDKNTIIIRSTIDDISGGQLKIPVWEAGRGAGTTNQNPLYSIQAINPFNESGITGAGGDYSIAGGRRTKAIGNSSVSFGTDNVSSGENSFTMGNLSESSLTSNSSISVGYNCLTNTKYSSAFGYKAKTGFTTSIPIDTFDNFQNNGSGEIIFAIGSEKQFQESEGSQYHNIFEVDTCGNVWSASLGQLSSTITPFLRNNANAPNTSGVYCEFNDNPQTVYAIGERSFAMGKNVETKGNYSFIDGSGCNIEEGGNYSVVFGENNIVSQNATHALVVGENNISKGKNSMIFGKNCKSADYSFAGGFSCDASGNFSVSLGVNNIAAGDYSVSLGGANYSFGQSSVALGRNSRAIGVVSTAIGCHSEAEGAFSVAIGKECRVGIDASNSVSFGADCLTNGIGSITLGKDSTTTGNYCFSGNGATAKGNYSIAIGNKCMSIGEGSITIGQDCSANFQNSVAIGKNCDISGNFAIGLGFGSKCSGENSFASGKNCISHNDYTISFGNESESKHSGSIAMGLSCLANNSKTSIAMGDRANTSNYAAWRGTSGSIIEPKDNTYTNAPTFRESRGGIIFAIGASGNSVKYNGINEIDGSGGNILELYADGSIWSSNIGILEKVADSSSVKFTFSSIGDDTTTLLKVNSGNNGSGLGSIIVGNNSVANGEYSFSSGNNNRIPVDASFAITMGYDCSAQGIYSVAIGNKCNAMNDYSIALGNGGSTSTSSSGGDISANNLIFAIGVSGEDHLGNVLEIDDSGSIWTKQLGTLSSTIPALGAVPIGGIIPFAGSKSVIPPTNWLWCDGGEINHINEPKYAPLFLVIGETYGNGGAPGGFNVPNLENSWPMGNANHGGDVTDIGKKGNSPSPTIDDSNDAPLAMRWLIRYG